MTGLLEHLKKYVSRGVVAIIPTAIVAGLLYLIYDLVDKNVGLVVGLDFPGLGILLLIVLLYAVGLLASSLGGRVLFGVVEFVSHRIPMVGSVYRVGKQLSSTLSLSETDMFRRAILVRFLNSGTWTIGFVTGSIQDQSAGARKHLTVFIPTPPNPFSGTMIIVPEDETRDPGWTIEEALQAVLSGGLLAPSQLR